MNTALKGLRLHNALVTASSSQWCVNVKKLHQYAAAYLDFHLQLANTKKSELLISFSFCSESERCRTAAIQHSKRTHTHFVLFALYCSEGVKHKPKRSPWMILFFSFLIAYQIASEVSKMPVKVCLYTCRDKNQIAGGGISFL